MGNTIIPPHLLDNNFPSPIPKPPAGFVKHASPISSSPEICNSATVVTDRQAPMVTVILKIRLHCEGCNLKIKRIISKINGVQEVTIDNCRELVTVKGTLDVINLSPYLRGKLKTSVDIVPQLPPPFPPAAQKADAEKIDSDGGENLKTSVEIVPQLPPPFPPAAKKADAEKIESNGGEKLKTSVEIVPPPTKKADGENKEINGSDCDGNKKADGGNKEVNGSGEKKNGEGKAPGGDDDGGDCDGNEKGYQAAKADGGSNQVNFLFYTSNQINYYGGQGGDGYGYTHGSGPEYDVGPGYGARYRYGPGYGAGPGYDCTSSSDIFSDENPNGCSVM